jgi:hypothetical protein
MIQMKLKSALVFAAALGFAASLSGADKKIVAGPKGGKLLETTGQKTEFFVNKDRKVEINFHDAALKPVAPGAQVVTVTAEPTSGRQQIEFEKTATGFVSKTKLPEGDPYRVVVQLREKADARPQNFRFEFNMEKCGGCKLAEYACICGH